jgi:hypothetical protein
LLQAPPDQPFGAWHLPQRFVNNEHVAKQADGFGVVQMGLALQTSHLINQ